MNGTLEEMNIIEASGGKNETENDNNNNNFEKTKTIQESSEQTNDGGAAEKRQKFYPQFIYKQNFEEALRSLLWEPYDCREDFNTWYYDGLNDNEEGTSSFTMEVPEQMFLSSSESSISSSSNFSSLEEIATVEVKHSCAFSLQSDNVNGFNVKTPKEYSKTKACCLVTAKLGRDSKDRKTIEMSALMAESKLKSEQELFSGFSKSKCSDPVQKQTDIGIMVSDLHFQNEYGFSSWNEHDEALRFQKQELGASARQYEFDCRSEDSRQCDRDKNALSASYKMLLTVEGTLEPRDSNEGTYLVSSDTSLDINENAVRLSGENRTQPGSSSGNVSVVNCYRAVPVSVVSTVPSIKCLNTQRSVSNVNIIQTSSYPDQKSRSKEPSQSPPKRQIVPASSGPVPGTSRVKAKVPVMDSNKAQIRPNLAVEQDQSAKSVTKIATKTEKPRSAAICTSEMSSEPIGQMLNQKAPAESNGVCLAVSNHNRSVSNPVLGNKIKSTQSRFGSQQNIPIRLETHFGPNSPDGAEHSQTFLTQRSSSNFEGSGQQQTMEDEENRGSKPSPRTFTSTEAQTDDVPLEVHSRTPDNREQRRRERRERRHQRRFHQSVLNSGAVWQTNVDIMHRDRRGLPDILNSHMPPPYSAVSMSMSAMPTMSPPIHVPSPISVPANSQTLPHIVESPPGQPLPHQSSFTFPFPFAGGGRRSQGQVFAHEEETPKSCCGVVVTQTVSIRWFIVMISFVGICCVIVGTVLGAMKASGREHLTVSLLMIGVGIVLVTVSVVAWRLTSQDTPSCRSMLGLGSADDSGNEPNQRFVPRMPPSYGRPHHPYAAMMYPEFQYRPPPPSYQASMQEYRLRLLLLERPNDTPTGLQATVSPPPTYRSQAGSTLGLRAPALCRSLPQSEYSHPPSYRSRTSSTRPTLDPNGDTMGSINHSRNSSLLSHVSDQNGNVSQAVVNVISVMGNTVDLRRGDTDLQLDSIKRGVDEEVPIPPLRMFLNKGKRSPSGSLEETKSENVNLVTIVTVSDNNSTLIRDHSVESDVLAHL